MTMTNKFGIWFIITVLEFHHGLNIIGTTSEHTNKYCNNWSKYWLKMNINCFNDSIIDV